MTRKSIEACAKLFILALFCTFVWAVYTVLHLMGYVG